MKRELSHKAKLSIYGSIYVPALTYGHGLWVVTKRTRLQKMSFLCRVAGLKIRHGEKLRQPGDAESGVTAPLHLKEPVEMVRPPGRRPKTY